MKFDFEQYADEVDYATYDPDDDKIRIYSGRVCRELYDALKAAKFNRAYKQGCFYAKWYPGTEDIALALCSEIDDEDTSLFDRAEERHSRFATYSSNAEQRAEQAIKAGDDAVGGIPFGQPILVGHHSERKHRKAVERAQRAADRTVEELDRRDYWQWRAKGVLRNANRKFDRGVVMRRIKKLESELRKKQRELDGKDYDHALGYFIWDLEHEYPDEFEGDNRRLYAATAWRQKKDLGGEMPQTEARLQKWQVGRERYCNRWIEHLDGQIEYWKTILEDRHGEDIDEQYPLKKGCWIRCGYGWAQVERVNKGADKRISSVSIDKDTASWYNGQGWFYPRIVKYPSIKEWSKTDPSSEEVLEAQLERIGPPRKEKIDPLREQAEAKAEAAHQVEVKVNYNPDYYPTPPEVVEQMLDAASLRPGNLVLEPSAGDGRIVERVFRRMAEAYWYEINTAAIETLQEKGYGGLQRGTDFMEAEPEPIYDAVVMNPPFSRNQGRKHVMHAWEFVKPGGVLVAILPGNKPQLDNKFGQWLVEQGFDRWVTLPEGVFEDTNVRAHMLVMRKDNYAQGKLL